MKRRKRMEGRIDFVDLLLRFAGISMSPSAKGITNVKPLGELPELTHLLMDEHQDVSALLQKCCDRFVSGVHTEKATFCGDPFQSIYGFGGSSPRFLMNMKVDSNYIMPRSYRCCRAVMNFSEDLIARQRSGYFERNVEPADHAGSVRHHEDSELGFLEIDPNSDTLVVARTNYRVKEAAGLLNELSIPYGYVDREPGPTVTQTACTALDALQRGEPVDGVDFARVVEKLPLGSRDPESFSSEA